MTLYSNAHGPKASLTRLVMRRLTFFASGIALLSCALVLLRPREAFACLEPGSDSAKENYHLPGLWFCPIAESLAGLEKLKLDENARLLIQREVQKSDYPISWLRTSGARWATPRVATLGRIDAFSEGMDDKVAEFETNKSSGQREPTGIFVYNEKMFLVHQMPAFGMNTLDEQHLIDAAIRMAIHVGVYNYNRGTVRPTSTVAYQLEAASQDEDFDTNAFLWDLRNLAETNTSAARALLLANNEPDDAMLDRCKPTNSLESDPSYPEEYARILRCNAWIHAAGISVFLQPEKKFEMALLLDRILTIWEHAVQREQAEEKKLGKQVRHSVKHDEVWDPKNQNPKIPILTTSRSSIRLGYQRLCKQKKNGGSAFKRAEKALANSYIEQSEWMAYFILANFKCGADGDDPTSPATPETQKTTREFLDLLLAQGSLDGALLALTLCGNGALSKQSLAERFLDLPSDERAGIQYALHLHEQLSQPNQKNPSKYRNALQNWCSNLGESVLPALQGKLKRLRRAKSVKLDDSLAERFRSVAESCEGLNCFRFSHRLKPALSERLAYNFGRTVQINLVDRETPRVKAPATSTPLDAKPGQPPLPTRDDLAVTVRAPRVDRSSERSNSGNENPFGFGSNQNPFGNNVTDTTLKASDGVPSIPRVEPVPPDIPIVAPTTTTTSPPPKPPDHRPPPCDAERTLCSSMGTDARYIATLDTSPSLATKQASREGSSGALRSSVAILRRATVIIEAEDKAPEVDPSLLASNVVLGSPRASVGLPPVSTGTTVVGDGLTNSYTPGGQGQSRVADAGSKTMLSSIGSPILSAPLQRTAIPFTDFGQNAAPDGRMCRLGRGEPTLPSAILSSEQDNTPIVSIIEGEDSSTCVLFHIAYRGSRPNEPLYLVFFPQLSTPTVNAIDFVDEGLDPAVKIAWVDKSHALVVQLLPSADTGTSNVREFRLCRLP